MLILSPNLPLFAVLQTELAYGKSTSVTGAQLQEGADAAAAASSRGRSSTQVSTVTGITSSNSASARRESTLQQWLVPDIRTRYWALWTSIFVLSACFIFAFMAGNFAVYQQSPTFKDYHRESQLPLQVQWGPVALEGWLKFWLTTPENSFDVGYLINWGAR